MSTIRSLSVASYVIIALAGVGAGFVWGNIHAAVPAGQQELLLPSGLNLMDEALLRDAVSVVLDETCTKLTSFSVSLSLKGEVLASVGGECRTPLLLDQLPHETMRTPGR